MKKLLELAINAAIDAGAEIMKIYANDFEVELKSDNSPLTIADQNANDVINSFLKTTDIPIISEENKQLPFEKRKDWDICWMVDPLDGTKEFVKKNGEFTVNIALIKNNKPVLGVIYMPVEKTLYYSIVDDGCGYKAILANHSFDIDEIKTNSDKLVPDLNDSLSIKVVGSRSHKSEATENFISSLKEEGKEVELVSKGSSLKFCLVAEGNANVYPRYAPTMEWDTAAGHAICNAVGLKVLQVPGLKEELVYNKENLLNPYFLVK